jgi:hypothetical protein
VAAVAEPAGIFHKPRAPRGGSPPAKLHPLKLVYGYNPDKGAWEGPWPVSWLPGRYRHYRFRWRGRWISRQR